MISRFAWYYNVGYKQLGWRCRHEEYPGDSDNWEEDYGFPQVRIRYQY